MSAAVLAVVAAFAELQKAPEDLADALEVVVDDLVGEELAALVLARRIADARGAAAHQRDRPVAGLLQPVEQHDRQQRADMQRRRRAVEADIGGDGRRARERIQGFGLRNLVDEPPLGEDVEKIGLVGAHRLPA